MQKISPQRHRGSKSAQYPDIVRDGDLAPPDGCVRVAAPITSGWSAIRQLSRGWVSVAAGIAQEPHTPRELIETSRTR